MTWQVYKFAFAAVLAFMLSFANAQDAENAEPPKQVQLTADLVKRFVATFGEIRKWQQANETTSKTGDDDDADEEDGGDDASAQALMQAAKSSSEVKAILAKNNFEDVEKFGEIAQSVMSAYYYADPESGQGADYEVNLKKSIEQVKSNQEISEEEKKLAIENIESEVKNAQKRKPLPGNVEIVKPYVAEIKKVVESD